MNNQACDNRKIIDQVKRATGQVEGLGRMIENGRDCGDILQQIVAARAGLQKLGILLLEAEAQGCFGSGKSSGKIKDLEKIMVGLFKIT